MIEKPQAENAALTVWSKATETEGERVRMRVAKVENQLGRLWAEEFWDRVRRETAGRGDRRMQERIDGPRPTASATPQSRV